MPEGNKTVSIEYTVFLADGSQVDSNVGGEPLVFESGQNQILPALEKALEGLSPGDTTRVTLSADEAYGPVLDEAFQEVATSLIPEQARHEGAVLVAEDESGQQRQVRVHEVKGETTVIDLNHPLAGESLTFDVKVIEIS